MDEETRIKPAATPWGVRDVIIATVLIVVSFAVFLGVAALLVRVLGPLGHGPLARILLFVLTAVSEGTLLVAAWLFTVRKYRVPWATLGFRPFRLTRDLPAAAVAVVLFFVVNWIYAAVVFGLGLDSLVPPPVQPLFEGGVGGLLMGLAVAAVVAPLSEEAFFRGFVLRSVESRRGPVWGAVVSAVLFAISHLQYQVVIPIFVLGLLLALIYLRTRSLWSCVVAHALYNGVALAVSVLASSAGVVFR